MQIPRPATGIKWLLRQTAVYDAVVAVLVLFVGLPTVANYWAAGRHRLAITIATAMIGVALLNVVKHAVALASARNKESTHELEGCLHTLHQALAPDDGCRLRLCIHVPAGNDHLEQVTEYVGVDPKAGRIGRRFPATSGIIGKAFREKDVFVGSRQSDDYEQYVREMIREWSFTEQQARQLDAGAMAWMAVPFMEDDKVYAVLFLDANQRDFFTEARQELVLRAQRGIAIFVGRRYA